MSSFIANLRLVIFIVVVIVFIVFLLQNTGDTPIKFLVFDGNVPSVVLILVTTLSGFIAGYFMGSTSVRRRKAKEPEAPKDDMTKSLG